jgi:hypothetical protein
METLPQNGDEVRSQDGNIAPKVKQVTQTSFLPLTRSFFACGELRRPTTAVVPLTGKRPRHHLSYRHPTTAIYPAPHPTTAIYPAPHPTTTIYPAPPPRPSPRSVAGRAGQIGRSAKLPLTHHGASVLFGVPLVLLKQRSIRSITVEASQCDNRKGASMLSWQQIYHRRCLLRLRNSRHKDLQSVRVRRGCRMRFEVKRIV